MHHTVKEHHQRFHCIYCGNELLEHKWHSEFIEEKHYKKTKCSCGKEARLKVDFFGSGHDSWEKESTIENKL